MVRTMIFLRGSAPPPPLDDDDDDDDDDVEADEATDDASGGDAAPSTTWSCTVCDKHLRARRSDRTRRPGRTATR